MRTLVVGVGSAIRGDDGVGPLLAARVCAAAGESFESLAFAGSGLDLLGEVSRGAWGRVVLIDSLDSGQLQVGEVARLDTRDLVRKGGPRRYVSSHHVGLLEAFALARQLGLELPRQLVLYAVGIRPATEFREELGPELAARVVDLVAEILDDLGREGGAS